MNMRLAWELAKCAAPDCVRQVKPSVAQCCTACAAAAADRHQAHQHSGECEQRHAWNGPWPLGPSGYRTKLASAVQPPAPCGPVRGPGRIALYRAEPGWYDTDPHAPVPGRRHWG